MTTGMPELGSKISLISKADIRYEGHLFTVDPQECTIALASVRSFGTEDRETQFPVPAQNQVYDYILFRGSDIKDIRVVNSVAHQQPLNDPAIMQLSVPPTLGGQTFQRHPVLGPMTGPQMGQFGGAYGGMGAPMGGLGASLGPGLAGMQQQRDIVPPPRGLNSKPSELIVGSNAPSSVLSPTVEPPRSQHDNDLIGAASSGGGAGVVGSRSTTPASLGSRKSPTVEQGVQTAGGRGGQDKRQMVRPIQPPGSGGGGQRGGGSGTGQQMRRKSRERRDSRGAEVQRGGAGAGSQRNQQGNHPMQHANHGGYHQGGGYQHHQGGYQQQQQNNRSGGNWVNRGPMRPNRGKPRGMQNGNYRPNQGGQGNKAKGTLKFDNDYDFEQANTQFEELRSQLGKIKIDDGSGSNSTTKSDAPSATPLAASAASTNGDSDKKDDSGNETGAGETEQEEDHEVYYDWTKSFFDKISCEAVERAKGKSQRTDWRTERKLNSETFGVAATRRGVYRGRGGYRGMGYRGGYRTNYRPMQRRDQQQQQQNSTTTTSGGQSQQGQASAQSGNSQPQQQQQPGNGQEKGEAAVKAMAADDESLAHPTNISNKEAIPVPAPAGL